MLTSEDCSVQQVQSKRNRISYLLQGNKVTDITPEGHIIGEMAEFEQLFDSWLVLYQCRDWQYFVLMVAASC